MFQYLRKSLFLQQIFIVLILTIGSFGFLYQFSISFAENRYKTTETELKQINSRVYSLVAYNIEVNQGKIKKAELENYIKNLILLNPVLEQITIFDVTENKQILKIGVTQGKQNFKSVQTENIDYVYVASNKQMSLFDRISYQLMGASYEKISNGISPLDFKTKNTNKLMIFNSPLENIQIQIISSFKNFENTYTSFLRAGIIGFFVFSFISIIFLSHLYLKVIHPISKLKRGAVEIAKGNLRNQIKVKGHDEIGVIGTFFNEVARNLREITNELYEKDRLVGEVNIAARIQEALIPPHAPDIPGLDIKIGNKPAEEIGGDSLDFIVVDDNNIMMYIGDVSGHGIPAGLVMTMVDILIHGFADVYSDIATMMINLNKHLTPKIDASMFMTMLMLNWNHKEQTFTYVGAGHEAILHYRAGNREVDVIKPGGIALGMINDNAPLVQTGSLKPEIGDVLVLYTDGIPEAKGGEAGMDFYGLINFKEAVKKYAIQSTAELIFQSLTEDLSRHMGQTKQADDITLIVIKYVGVSAQEKNVKLSISEHEFKNTHRTGKWNWRK